MIYLCRTLPVAIALFPKSNMLFVSYFVAFKCLVILVIF